VAWLETPSLIVAPILDKELNSEKRVAREAQNAAPQPTQQRAGPVLADA
jgi:hypothetical protein